MKNTKIWMLAFALASLTIFTSCGGDDAGTSLEITLNGEEIAVEGVNIYLFTERSYNYVVTRSEGANYSHTYRDYVITDGTFTGTGDQGWNGIESDVFSDATFVIVVETAIPYGEEFEGGTFPQYSSWLGQIGADDKASWIQIETTIGGYQYCYTDTYGGDPVIVSGDMNVDGKMKISFDGGDLYNDTEDTDNATLQLSLSGKVLDALPAIQ